MSQCGVNNSENKMHLRILKATVHKRCANCHEGISEQASKLQLKVKRMLPKQVHTSWHLECILIRFCGLSHASEPILCSIDITSLPRETAAILAKDVKVVHDDMLIMLHSSLLRRPKAFANLSMIVL
jgi:hypothetical protein